MITYLLLYIYKWLNIVYNIFKFTLIIYYLLNIYLKKVYIFYIDLNLMNL